MRNEFLATLPENLATGLDKRKLIKNIKSRDSEIPVFLFVSMKCFLWNIISAKQSETIYPREQQVKGTLMRQFDTLKVLRVIRLCRVRQIN